MQFSYRARGGLHFRGQGREIGEGQVRLLHYPTTPSNPIEREAVYEHCRLALVYCDDSII